MSAVFVSSLHSRIILFRVIYPATVWSQTVAWDYQDISVRQDFLLSGLIALRVGRTKILARPIAKHGCSLPRSSAENIEE